MTTEFSEKTDRTIRRAAKNVLRKHPSGSFEVDDLVQDAWLYILEHEDWYIDNGHHEERLYRRVYDRLVVIVQREQKKRVHETSLEALDEESFGIRP